MSQKKQAVKPTKVWKVVEVTWIDTVTSDGWEQTYIQKAVEVISIGYLCKRTDKGIALVQTFCEEIDQPYSASIFIPAGVIKKVRVIRKEKRHGRRTASVTRGG